MTSAELKWYERAFYAFGKFLAVLLTALVYPLRVQGREHFPKEGSFIVIANHISMWEVFFIPRMLLPRRTVFMAKSELFEKNAFVSWVIRTVGAFPVKRGTADIGAIKRSLDVIKSGDIFAIFPEGTRNKNLDGSLLKFNNGVGYIALMSGVPVVPVFFDHMTDRFKPFRPIRIVVGPPVDLAALKTGGRVRSETTEQATAAVLEALSALM